MITIQGKPVPKPSARQGNRGHFYNPKKAYMDSIKLYLRSVVKHKPILGPIKLKVTYHMPIPKTGPNSKKVNGDWHIIVPDEDNMTKLIKDCMTGIVWKDDCQVAWPEYKKVYSDNPRTEIEYWEL